MKATVWTIGFRLGLFLSAGRNKTKQKNMHDRNLGVLVSPSCSASFLFFSLLFSPCTWFSFACGDAIMFAGTAKSKRLLSQITLRLQL